MLTKREKAVVLTGTIIVSALAVFAYFELDRPMALWFHALHDNPIEDAVNALSVLGESQWYIIPALLLWLWFRRKGRALPAQKALYLLLANIVAGVAVWMLKIPFGRLRPKMLFEHQQYGFEGLGLRYPYVSFPSGHSITIFATATALALLFPRYRVPLFILATVVAFSRVTRGAHYFSDVLVGSWLGVLVSLFLYHYMFGAKHGTH